MKNHFPWCQHWPCYEPRNIQLSLELPSISLPPTSSVITSHLDSMSERWRHIMEINRSIKNRGISKDDTKTEGREFMLKCSECLRRKRSVECSCVLALAGQCESDTSNWRSARLLSASSATWKPAHCFISSLFQSSHYHLSGSCDLWQQAPDNVY